MNFVKGCCHVAILVHSYLKKLSFTEIHCCSHLVSWAYIHTLLYKKKFYKKFSLKTPKTLKYLKKSPASNAWAAILKNDEISSLKVIKWFSIFYLKFLTVLLINGSSILFTKHGKIKRRKLWDVYPC